MTCAPPTAHLDFADLIKLATPERERFFTPLFVALVAHAGFALAPSSPSARIDAVPPAVEVELPSTQPPPAPAPEPEPAVPPTQSAAAQRSPVRAAAPAAAAAPHVLTASEAAPPADPHEPFDFTSDPNSRAFGIGVVAVGGHARQGLNGARPGGHGSKLVRARSTRGASAGSGLTPLSDLSRLPRLVRQDPCRGFFPSTASGNMGRATVRVVVGKSGSASRAMVLSETPTGQGFGAAARRCMLGQPFKPALGKSGAPTATAVTVNVRFTR